MASTDQPVKPPTPHGASSGPWNDLPLPLRECGEIAVLRLSSALSEALTQAADHLFDEATQALTQHEREAFLDAGEFARQYRHGMVYDFMKHFERRYQRACQRRPDPLLGHVIDFDVKEMKIVEHQLLDDSLEPGKITEAIQNASWKTLQALTSQFRELLDCQEIMPNDIPLGPKVIEAAVSDAIRDQPWRHKAKHRLANALRWGLAARVNLLYRDLFSLLGARDLKAFAESDEVHEDACLMEEAASSAASPAQADGEEDAEQVFLAEATEAARLEVARCLGSAVLPHPMVEFLSRHWRDYILETILREGEGSASWREAVSTMDDLAWSLSPKSSQEDFLRLKEGLPGLLKRLNHGMDAIALAQPVRDRFFVHLLQAHGEAVQRTESSLPPPRIVSLPVHEIPLQAAPPPTPSAKPLDTPNPAAPSATLYATPPAAPSPVVAETPLPSMPPRPEAVPSLDAALSNFKVGSWFEFRDAQGLATELKLAWVSPHRNLFLLTNRRGERALSIMAEEFATRLQQGQARLVHLAKDHPLHTTIMPGGASKKTA